MHTSNECSHSIKLRKNLDAYLSSKAPTNRKAKNLFDNLQLKNIRGYIFGGFVRDIFERGFQAQPNDIDLVFEGENYDHFIHHFKSFIDKKNRFGGTNLTINGFLVDAWRLEDTWAFKKGGFYKDDVSVEQLPSTTFLNIDGIVTEAWVAPGKQRKIFEAGFYQFYNSQLLDVNLDENPHAPLAILRTFKSAIRNRCGMSRDLTFSIIDKLKECSIKEIHDTQIQHYKRELITIEHLQDLEKRLRCYSNNKQCDIFYVNKPIYQPEIVFTSSEKKTRQENNIVKEEQSHFNWTRAEGSKDRSRGSK